VTDRASGLQRGGAFFAIAGGRARVQRSDGHEVILGHGDFFGDLSLIDGANETPRWSPRLT
jgi:hypothetical protein